MNTPRFNPGDEVQVAPNCTKFFKTDGNRVFYQSLGKGIILEVSSILFGNKGQITTVKYKVEFRVDHQGATIWDVFMESELIPDKSSTCPTPKFRVNQYVCTESMPMPGDKKYSFGCVSKIVMHNYHGLPDKWYIGYKVVWNSTGLESEISESELKAAEPPPQETPEMDPNQFFTPPTGNYDAREVAKALRLESLEKCNSPCTSKEYDVAASRIALADVVESFYNTPVPQPKRIETSDLKALGFKLSESVNRYYGKVPNTSRNIYVEPLFDGYVKVSYGDMIKDTNDIQVIKDLINFLHTFNDAPTPT